LYLPICADQKNAWWIFNWQISFLYFNNIGLMQCSQTLSIISSTDWEKNHWSDETSPAF
jgi:hypothetical protein